MNRLRSFEEIYKQHSAAVFRFCVRAVSQRDIAEDITSEVFLALHRSWSKVTPEQIPAWLFTVAKRRAADYWRHRYVEENWASTLQSEGLWAEPEHSLADLLRRCTGLKPIHRVCVTLRFGQGMSRAEIAQQLELSEMQVKGHLQYALQLLRQSMLPVTAAEGTKEGKIA
jgi:RNA polymerase sigma-70 factor (ECF subfamily)